MSLDRQIWLVDTIKRHGRITRQELSRLWLLSAANHDGKPLARRTFANDRAEAERLFGITINCDHKTFEYYIEEVADMHKQGAAEWLLNSATLAQLSADMKQAAHKVFLEDVPSAREHLATVMKALAANHHLHFDYQPFTRSRPSRGVVLQPYFLKLFRQRWYVTGLNPTDNKIKTYALDRMEGASVGTQTFQVDPTFDVESYEEGAFGVMYDQSPVREVKLKVSTSTAKYLRTLPLHPSQQEFVHDLYSIFTYRLRLTRDLVQEILARGAQITVLAPNELRVMVQEELRQTLSHYE